MTNLVDRFYAALTVLAGHGHIKQRLMKAYGDNLADLHEDELPVALQEDFAELRREMHQVAPLNGEGAICASVRKMSGVQASECGVAILALYNGLLKMRDDPQSALPLRDVDETRVPPILIKSL